MYWFEEEVRQLENGKPAVPYYRRKVVFYGSSSIRLWEDLPVQFPDKPFLNLGFGGSTLAACAWYFERLVLPHRPDSIVLYAGDNDLGDGRHPEEVLLYFQALTRKIIQYLGQVHFSFISIKPSLARWHLIEQIRYTNQIIRADMQQFPHWHYVDIFHPMLDSSGRPPADLFTDDGLHLSARGYQVWAAALREHQHYIF
jgi:lysophospholipase L1-like esterase